MADTDEVNIARIQALPSKELPFYGLFLFFIGNHFGVILFYHKIVKFKEPSVK